MCSELNLWQKGILVDCSHILSSMKRNKGVDMNDTHQAADQVSSRNFPSEVDKCKLNIRATNTTGLIHLINYAQCVSYLSTHSFNHPNLP